MVKTYFKTVRRMFRHHLIRLLSLIGVILISIGFISGIGSPTDMIQDSIEKYYRNRNVSDFIVKSKSGSFTDDQISAVRARYGEKNVNTGLSVDILLSALLCDTSCLRWLRFLPGEAEDFLSAMAYPG